MTTARLLRLENEDPEGPTMVLEVDCTAVAGVEIRIRGSDGPRLTATLQYTLFEDDVVDLIATLLTFQERLVAFRSEKRQ